MTHRNDVIRYGAVNRGFHQEGLFLEKGNDYVGYLFARLGSSGSTSTPAHPATTATVATPPVNVYVGLRDYFTGRTIAQQQFTVAATDEWQQLNFSLTPGGSSTCVDFPYGQPPLNCPAGLEGRPGHACWQCSGELAVWAEAESPLVSRGSSNSAGTRPDFSA